MEPTQNVQFEEVPMGSSSNSSSKPKLGATTKFFIKIGLAKDQKGVNQVMVAFTILCFILMLYFLVSTYDPKVLNFRKPKVVNTIPNSEGNINPEDNINSEQ